MSAARWARRQKINHRGDRALVHDLGVVATHQIDDATQSALLQGIDEWLQTVKGLQDVFQGESNLGGDGNVGHVARDVAT